MPSTVAVGLQFTTHLLVLLAWMAFSVRALLSIILLCVEKAVAFFSVCAQVHEACLSKELVAAHQAMAASQQQQQQEQDKQDSARQQLEVECRSLRQQLDKARADASLTRGAAEQAQGFLRKMLVQVRVGHHS